MSDQELKPCPFCGAALVDGMITHSNECFIHKLIYQYSADELEKAWQIRTPDSMLEELAMALGNLLFECDGAFDTCKPTRHTYNLGFAALQRYRASKVQP